MGKKKTPAEPATTEQLDSFFSRFCDPYKISSLENRHNVTGHPRAQLAYLSALSSAGRRFQEFQLTDLSNWLHGFAEESSKLCKLSLSGSHYVAAQLCQIALLKVRRQDWFGSKGERSRASFSKREPYLNIPVLNGKVKETDSIGSTDATVASQADAEDASSDDEDCSSYDSDYYDEVFNPGGEEEPGQDADTNAMEKLVPSINAWREKAGWWSGEEAAREETLEYSYAFKEIVKDVISCVAQLMEKALMPCTSEISAETFKAWSEHNKNYSDKETDYIVSFSNHVAPSCWMERAYNMDMAYSDMQPEMGAFDDMTRTFKGSYWDKAILGWSLDCHECLQVLQCMVLARICCLAHELILERDKPFANFTCRAFPALVTMKAILESRLNKLSSMILEWRDNMDEDSSVSSDSDKLPDLIPVPISDTVHKGIKHALEKIMPETKHLQMAKDFKKSLVQDVFEILGTEAKPFGSFHSGFMSNSSDLDLMVPLTHESKTRLELWGREAAVPGVSERQAAAAAACHFLSSSLSRKHSDIILKPVAGANVPVLKVKKVASADAVVSVDITFDNWLGVYNSDLLKAYAETDPRVRFLGILVKYWAKRRGLDNVLEGGLAPYAWVLMVIFFCQMREAAPLLPNLQRFPPNTTAPHVRPIHDSTFYDPPSLPSPPPASASVEVLPRWRCPYTRKCMLKSCNPPKVLLTDLIKEFFAFYATKFNWFANVISIRHAPEVMSKVELLKSGASKSEKTGSGSTLSEATAAEDAEGGGSHKSSRKKSELSSESSKLKPHRAVKARPYIGSSHQMKSMLFLVVEDPFEQCRLLFTNRKSGAYAIAKELTRAHSLLCKNESFFDIICEADS